MSSVESTDLFWHHGVMDLLHDPRVAAAGVSGREAEVLAAVGRRLTNREIAAELFISVRTVESHVAALLRKLAAPSRSALLEIAIDAASRAAFPRPTTSFVGRVDELQTVSLRVAEHSLVTLLGPGGCGKTRLAQEVAARWPGEVRMVDLATLGPANVESALMDALDLGTDSVPNLAGRAQITLAGRSILLVMDNCEHVVDAAASGATKLLEGAPELHVLAGSRRPLDLPAESIFRVAPLALPIGHDTDSVRASPAGQLFMERAGSIRASFVIDEFNAGSVATICERVDGLPLAIELAAASLRSMSVDELASALHHRGSLPGRGGRSLRHRTMHAAIEWSWSLLSDDEAALLSRLATLPGALFLEEVVRVEPLGLPPVTDVLSSLVRLVDQSMVIAHIAPGNPTRYDLLETIRAFAVARIADDDAAEVRQAFARVERDVLAAAASKSRTGDLRVYRDEQDRRKVLAALSWSAKESPTVGQDLLVSIASHYELDPSRTLLEGVRDVVESHAIPDGWQAKALAWAGLFLNYLSLDLLQKCAQLAVERAVGEEDAAFADWASGFAHAYRDETEAALTALAKASAYFSTAGNEWMVAHCSMARGLAETDPTEAVAAFEQSMLTFLKVGAPWHANSARMALVRRALEAEINVGGATRWLQASLAYAQHHGTRHDRAHAKLAEAQLSALHGRTDDTLSLGAQSAQTFRQIGDLRCLGRALMLMAALESTPTNALRLSGEALEVALLQGDRRGQATALGGVAETATAAGDLVLAARAIGAAASITSKPPSAEGVIKEEYASFMLEGRAGGPMLVLSHL